MPLPDQALYLGVDAGGTKTCFVLIDGHGTVRARHVAGSGYYLQIGMDGLEATLRGGIAKLLADAGAADDALTYAFFGLPSYGEDSRDLPFLDALPQTVLGHGRYTCGNDMICGWAGSLAGADGISITAGTGSIGYGERQGRAARAGGWGELFSDEGSAHWIARRALNLFSRMSDGRLPRGPLHDVLRGHFALGDDLDLCGKVLADGGAQRDRVAALSSVVAQAAGIGDTAVIGLFRDAAGELAQIAEAIRVALDYAPEEPVPLSYSGGVFEAGALVLEPLREALAAHALSYRLQKPLFEPGTGAALYARRLATA
jgi:N-acetylglucosamine kinase-like BadF-type ATPase